MRLTSFQIPRLQSIRKIEKVITGKVCKRCGSVSKNGALLYKSKLSRGQRSNSKVQFWTWKGEHAARKKPAKWTLGYWADYSGAPCAREVRASEAPWLRKFGYHFGNQITVGPSDRTFAPLGSQCKISHFLGSEGACNLLLHIKWWIDSCQNRVSASSIGVGVSNHFNILATPIDLAFDLDLGLSKGT